MESLIRIIDLIRWPITVIVLSWSATSILAEVVARLRPPAVQPAADRPAPQADGQDARFHHMWH